jgi:signal peptide peptidase SppA
MSRQTARLILDQMNMRPALIAERYARGMDISDVTSVGLLGDVRELARCDHDKEMAGDKIRRGALAAAYGYNDPLAEKPFVFVDGKAIIPVHGILVNRFAYSWSFITGYNFIKNQIDAAMADPDVDGIVYDVNTYGGTVAGCKETADAIYAASRKSGGKPSLAVVDSNCYSAGYMTMSGADKIVVTPSGGAGSIGVVLMHMDVSGALEKFGVKVQFITAPEDGHKVDGNPYEALSAEVKADLQAEINKMYGVFVSTVVRNRPNLSAQAVRDTKARCFLADDALALGLIDAVQTPPDALDGFFNATDPDNVTGMPDDDNPGDGDDDTDPTLQQKEADTMPETPEQKAAREATEAKATNDAAIAKAAADARTAERARVKAITGSPEAKGRETLAEHFAHNTDMSPEAAVEALKAAPKAEAVAPTTTTNVTAGGPVNPFDNAMNNSQNPNVGSNHADAAAGGPDADVRMKRAQEILAAQGRAVPTARK